MSGMKKPKKFNLDAELDRLDSWLAHGGVWKSYKATTGTRMPDCTVKSPCLRSGWYSFGGDDAKATYEYVSYTVSGGGAVVIQGLTDAFRARLIAASPDLLRFVKRIAEGDAVALSVVDEARELVKELREPIHVAGRHDTTATWPNGWEGED